MRHFRKVVALVAIVLLGTGCNAYLDSLESNPWTPVALDTDTTMLDLAFTDDLNHGWLVGKRSTLYETQDGGKTWESRKLELGEQPHTFTSVSFSGEEGWIVGQPSILLHTTDGGKSWSQIALSEQLPGEPETIKALGTKSAEMTTDVGAIYQTNDGGANWKALVQQAVGVVRNISRSADGRYVAVSSRGNFYSTWEPGQAAWQQHNRTSSKRLQNMGFGSDGQLWTIARGGEIQFSEPNSYEEWKDAVNPEFSTSWGLLDLAYRTPEEIWITGGSGNLLCSLDGGQTWLKDRAVENVPGNFYKIVFLNQDKGFVIGQNGVLLRYDA
ncbi:MAG: photosynthesis system II assembly factor Ycf48 [Thainema sp.]